MTLGSQSILGTQQPSTAASSRATGPKLILKSSKGKFLDPVSELLHQKKTTPRDVPPFEREKEEDSLTKLRRLHEKNVPTNSTAVKKLSGKPRFGLGGEEKHGGDSSSDDEIPSLKKVISSTSSNAIRNGLTKRYGIAWDDDEEKLESPVVLTAPMFGTSHTMRPDKDDDEEMDIDVWVDKETGIGKHGQSLPKNVKLREG